MVRHERSPKMRPVAGRNGQDDRQAPCLSEPLAVRAAMPTGAEFFWSPIRQCFGGTTEIMKEIIGRGLGLQS
jgi:hypothetical protein